MRLSSYLMGQWVTGSEALVPIVDATTGAIVAEVSTSAADMSGVLPYARSVGGVGLRQLTFQRRAGLLKELAKWLSERKHELYELSHATGATKADCVLDVDGGIGTLFSYAGRGAKELPDSNVYAEGAVESLSKSGAFIGRHICVPLEGAAIHINAFNFPVWGLLEKFAPAFLAGVPVVAKPASATAYVTERLIKQIVASGLLPTGALQLICGSVGNLLDFVDCQDVVAFTGSARTAHKLRAHPAIVRHSVRFSAETDSLNAAILGPDAVPGTPEFELFVAEVVREMTFKAGQRCTAIRRVLVPNEQACAAAEALKQAFATILVGDPRSSGTTMGPLASLAQRADVKAAVDALKGQADVLVPDPNVNDETLLPAEGAFVSPMLLKVRDVARADAIHSIEAFGPVCTLLPYADLDDAIALARRGQGSLVASAFTSDATVARTLMLGLAPYHGRVLIVDRQCGKEQTGHGSPMPGLIHGGPGRAGGGEELGGLRAVLHYMQRTALQGSPAMLETVVPA